MWFAFCTIPLCTLSSGWVAATAQATEVRQQELKSNQSSKRNTGSAQILTGHTVLLNVFVADIESDWSDAQKQSILGNMEQSLRFLSACAEPYQMDVRFEQHNLGSATMPSRVPSDPFANPAWTERAIQLAVGQDAMTLVREWSRKHNADNVVLCLHVNKPSQSYNLAHYANVEDCYRAERTVCFGRYPDGRATAAATYAHEILHLFGAGDLYFPYDTSSTRRRMANQLFPNDIMLRVDYDLAGLNVGPFTAFRVGWSRELHADHRLFEDRD